MKLIKRVMKLDGYDLPMDGISIYLTSKVTSWGADPKWRYKGKQGKYHLSVSLEKGTQFKHFVLSRIVDSMKVRTALNAAGYTVTGDGDPAPGKYGWWRTWFLIPGYKLEGDFPFNNNVW